jgi:hypothetical protein
MWLELNSDLSDFEEDDLKECDRVCIWVGSSRRNSSQIWQCLIEKLKKWDSSRDLYHTLDVTDISRDGREMPLMVHCGKNRDEQSAWK